MQYNMNFYLILYTTGGEIEWADENIVATFAEAIDQVKDLDYFDCRVIHVQDDVPARDLTGDVIDELREGFNIQEYVDGVGKEPHKMLKEWAEANRDEWAADLALDGEEP